MTGVLDRDGLGVITSPDMASRYYVLPVSIFLVELRSPAGSSFA